MVVNIMLSVSVSPLIDFDARCCHMGTAIKHPVPDRVKPLFHHLQFLTSGHSVLRAERQSARMSKIINCCTHMATVGIKGLTQPECGLTVGRAVGVRA